MRASVQLSASSKCGLEHLFTTAFHSRTLRVWPDGPRLPQIIDSVDHGRHVLNGFVGKLMGSKEFFAWWEYWTLRIQSNHPVTTVRFAPCVLIEKDAGTEMAGVKLRNRGWCGEGTHP